MHRLPWFLRWLAASLAAVAVLTFAFVLKGSGQPEPLPSGIVATPTSSANPASAISNLLVVLTDDAGAVTGAAVLSRQESGLHVVTINPNVAIDLGDSGVTSLATLVGQPSPGVVQAGVIQATGWQIDATIVMARLAFAGLIDLVGGIDVVSDRELLVGDPSQQQRFRVTAFLTETCSLDSQFPAVASPTSDSPCRRSG